MKKQLLILLFAILGGGAMVNAQTSESKSGGNAIGIRFSGGNFLGGEISYQKWLSSANRLEVDLGFNSYKHGNGFNLAGIYQWVWNIDGGFNWYAGPGAELGSWSWDSDYDGAGDSGFYLGIGGQIGVEYNFHEIPLMLSVDTRPMISIGNGYDDYNFGLALAVRYTF